MEVSLNHSLITKNHNTAEKKKKKKKILDKFHIKAYKYIIYVAIAICMHTVWFLRLCTSVNQMKRKTGELLDACSNEISADSKLCKQ